MNRQYVSLAVVLLAISYIFSACHSKMSKGTGELLFDSIRINETVHLFGDTAKPACNVIINFAYPSKSSEPMLLDSLNAYFIAECLGDKYVGEKPEKAVRLFADKYIADYRRDLETVFIEDKKNNGDDRSFESWYSYYIDVESRVQRYDKDLLVYRTDRNEYTGGAHGMHLTHFLNIDLTLMRPLRLNDLFVGNYTEPLTDLIWEQLMKDNHVNSREALEDLGYDSTGDITPTENFYLGKEGISFYYNEYDIAPYSMGATVVTLPYAAMKHLLGSNPILPK